MERRAFVELSGVGTPREATRSNEPDGQAGGAVSSAAALEAQQIERVVIPWVHRVPPNLFVPPPRAIRRLIVVDGCNIGRGSCGEGREAVNCLGLLCAMRYLVLRNFDVIAFIPPSYNNDQNPFVVYPYLLPKMRSLGILGFTASRTDAHGRGPVNYDDLYVLDYAERHGGVALSGDYFEDILNDPRHPQLREVIRRRRFGIRFHRFGEAVVHVDGDIFYRCFPEVYSLAPNETHVDVQRMANRLFVTPSSNEWARAVERRSMSWSRERQLRLLDGIDEMISEVTTTANLKSYSFRTGAPGGVILCDNREEQRAIRQSARAPSTPLQFLQFPTAYPSAPERPSRPPHPQPHQQPSIVADLTHAPPVRSPRSSCVCHLNATTTSAGPSSSSSAFRPFGQYTPPPYGRRVPSTRGGMSYVRRSRRSVTTRAPTPHPPPRARAPHRSPRHLPEAFALAWNKKTPPLGAVHDPRSDRIDLSELTPDVILRMFGVD